MAYPYKIFFSLGTILKIYSNLETLPALPAFGKSSFIYKGFLCREWFLTLPAPKPLFSMKVQEIHGFFHAGSESPHSLQAQLPRGRLTGSQEVRLSV